MNKKSCIHGWLILVIALSSNGFSQEKISIDLKVPLHQTADLTPAQLGASLFILRSDWATLSDVNEDAAVWLKDYERHINFLGQQVISCTLELRDPSMLRKGNLRKTQRITVRYWQRAEKSKKLDKGILNGLKALSDELQIEAYYLGQEITEELEDMLK